ncbi:glycosyltransferase family 4 protein [Halovenus marina]|uniref:glycosyltransferase family 4 protein n=1 Tax=Halovenus marina TaxID=3396621 RepID=UPI003F559EA6
MRVALVAMETTHSRDSASNRRFERIARLLADAGHDVTVFCSQWWNDYDDEWLLDGVRYYGVTLGSAPTSFCSRIPGLLARHRPDVVHVTPQPPQQVIAASVGATLARAPLFLEWYGNEGLDPDARATRWAIGRPDRIVTPSEMVRTEIRELGAADSQVQVIPESIDYEQVLDSRPGEETDVVYARRLDESANVEDLLLGLAELRDREWTATVVGDGPRRDAIESQTADLRIDDRVTFAGACDRQERLSIYRGAHAFVQTAYSEQFATELLWALACGCVGIVEYQAESSAHELIENYERSYRVTNPQQLADAIVDAGSFERLTEDDTWRSYDHSAIIERYVDAYERV